MYSLFLTLIISSGNTQTNAVDGRTFDNIQSCEQYKKQMNYTNSSHLMFKCGLTKIGSK